MKGSQFALFLTVVLSIWALMHAYVLWRVLSIPFVQLHLSRRWVIGIAVLLWSLYPLARMLEAVLPAALAHGLELVAATWIGFLFLCVAALFLADLATLGGWVFQPAVPWVRTGALGAALLLGTGATVQAMREPVLSQHEVLLEGLPPEHDGKTVVHLSDLHLGTLIGASWLERVVDRVQGLQPDMIVLVGDILDGRPGKIEPLVPLLRRLQAPLGVWGVTGNHEYYAGLETCLEQLGRAGIKILRDQSQEAAPGLVVAGVDDLTARESQRLGSKPVEQALANRPPGATLFLSHSPWHPETAASAGAGLMLCGHTHNGQIWPFNYLVRLRYPYVCGRYNVGAMTLLVGRGTGTWGPRMRLWKRGEIIQIRLRSTQPRPAQAAAW